MLMAVDSVDIVTTRMQCFCELMAALLQLLLSVDIVDMVFRAIDTGIVSLLGIDTS